MSAWPAVPALHAPAANVFGRDVWNEAARASKQQEKKSEVARQRLSMMYIMGFNFYVNRVDIVA